LTVRTLPRAFLAFPVQPALRSQFCNNAQNQFGKVPGGGYRSREQRIPLLFFVLLPSLFFDTVRAPLTDSVAILAHFEPSLRIDP
jgi:hypothetical protein